MNLLRKNLFRILVLVAGLGIADNAFADPVPLGKRDIILPFVNMGSIATTSIANNTVMTYPGVRGVVAAAPLVPQVGGTGIGTGMTLTTSIAAMPYAARLTVILIPGLSTQLRCDRLEIDGRDQYGREVGLGGAIPRYTFSRLTSSAASVTNAHTTSIAFSQVTRIRLNNCYHGNNCPGSSCTSVAPTGTQLRVLMSRHVGLPFKIDRLDQIESICRNPTPNNTRCFKSSARIVGSGSGTAAFTFNASRNTLSFPNLSAYPATHVTIVGSLSGGSGGTVSDLLTSGTQYQIILRPNRLSPGTF